MWGVKHRIFLASHPRGLIILTLLVYTLRVSLLSHPVGVIRLNHCLSQELYIATNKLTTLAGVRNLATLTVTSLTLESDLHCH